MGRWSQRQRRSTAESLAVIPPTPVNITAVTAVSGTRLELTFDGPITYTGGGGLAGFNVGGLGSTGAAQTGPTTLELDPDAAFVVTDPWDLSNSPPEITEPVVFPAAGTIA